MSIPEHLDILRWSRALKGLFTEKPPVGQSPDLLDRILDRRSCRRFTGEAVPSVHLERILDAGRFAPSTANMQTWTFIVMNSAQWKDVLGAALPFSAPLGIMVCADLHRAAGVFHDPGAPSTLYTMAVMNSSIAAMAMCLAAESMGYATIMLSDDGRTGLLDAPHIRRSLRLPQRVLPLMTLVVGKPAKGGIRPVVPPRQPSRAVVGMGAYPAADADGMQRWADKMRVGGRLTNLRGGLQGKIRYYSEKMKPLEQLLRSMLLEEFPS